MPGVGLVRSKIRPSRWLSPKSKQSFTNRQLLTTVSSKRFCARCVNLVSKSSSDPYPEPANAPAANIAKNPYLSVIPFRLLLFADRGANRVPRLEQIPGEARRERLSCSSLEVPGLEIRLPLPGGSPRH